MIESFAPVFDGESRVLILGSMASVKSLEAGFFYMHPRNRFWHTVCGFFGEAAPVSIEDKTAFLRRRAIALWDTVVSCEIAGSSDASIRKERVADVAGLICGSAIGAVFCNGKLAYRLLTERAAPLAVPVLCLPSTSPANPRFDVNVWNAALAQVFGEKY